MDLREHAWPLGKHFGFGKWGPQQADLRCLADGREGSLLPARHGPHLVASPRPPLFLGFWELKRGMDMGRSNRTPSPTKRRPFVQLCPYSCFHETTQHRHTNSPPSGTPKTTPALPTPLSPPLPPPPVTAGADLPPAAGALGAAARPRGAGEAAAQRPEVLPQAGGLGGGSGG